MLFRSDEAQKYGVLADGYTVPHDPQDYVDAVNWETVRAERLRCAEIRGGARRLRSGNKGEKKVEVENAREKVEGDEQVEADWEDWTAPDPLIESDLSGPIMKRHAATWRRRGPGLNRGDDRLRTQRRKTQGSTKKMPKKNTTWSMTSRKKHVPKPLAIGYRP